ncbi:MAG TPA: DUF2934 domain-containing protein [Blastocatellia bacterium]|nr:DUF2934 domain-containing protein [Blastocatellia bacterium]
MKKESIEAMRARLMRDDQVQTMIRMRAFEIYQGRGGQSGNPQHDWLQAENEILTYLIQEEAALGSMQTRSSVSSSLGSGNSKATASSVAKPRSTTRKTSSKKSLAAAELTADGEKKKTSRAKKSDKAKASKPKE